MRPLEDRLLEYTNRIYVEIFVSLNKKMALKTRKSTDYDQNLMCFNCYLGQYRINAYFESMYLSSKLQIFRHITQFWDIMNQDINENNYISLEFQCNSFYES